MVNVKNSLTVLKLEIPSTTLQDGLTTGELRRSLTNQSENLGPLYPGNDGSCVTADFSHQDSLGMLFLNALDYMRSFEYACYLH